MGICTIIIMMIIIIFTYHISYPEEGRVRRGEEFYGFFFGEDISISIQGTS